MSGSPSQRYAAAGAVPVPARRHPPAPPPARERPQVPAAAGGRARGTAGKGQGGRADRGAVRRARLSFLSCSDPRPGGEGEVEAPRVSWGQAAGTDGGGGGLAGPPRRPARLGLAFPALGIAVTLPASGRSSQLAGRVVLAPAGAVPGKRRAWRVPSLRRDAGFGTCGCRRGMLSAPPLLPRSTWQCFG